MAENDIDGVRFTQLTNLLISDEIKIGDVESNVELSTIAPAKINTSVGTRKVISIGATNVYFDIDQTTSLSPNSNPDFINSAPGEITYNGANDINVRIRLDFGVESASGTNALNAQILKNNDSLDEINGNAQAGTAGITQGLIAYTTLSTGDVIRSQIKNITNTVNFNIDGFSLEVSGRTG